MVDARGLSCPMPVVMVQKAVKEGHPDTIEVLLDSECSVENVTRFAKSAGYSVTVEKADGDSRLLLKK